MNKFPFTEQGTADLVAALHLLSDVALNIEAGDAAADFASWLLSKYSFEPSQTTYLSSMSSSLLSYMGAQVAVSLRHRLPLSLVKPILKGTEDTKLIETKSTIESSGDGSGGENATGGVIVEITY